ncbi:MAG: R.Pab1 family restriction endonuclease [Candidatus Paceibacterota bacterium]|jgi:hypothetical protein
MNYITEKTKIVLDIRATNDGKFRFKTRNNNLDFGETFATRGSNFSEKVYLEWQIGYDATVLDVKNGKKQTKLNRLSFIGANKKEKYPYELSELIFEAIKIGLISKNKIEGLLKEIELFSDFIDEKKIEVEHNKKIKINDIQFEETSIKLPTLFMIETADSTQIEISIQKQQYASGVQPMVYFCIPLTSFENGKTLYGKPSADGDNLTYAISDKNISVLFDLVKIFAMCSKRHNFDIQEILKILLKQI